jgi:hypothetical protein
LERQKQQQQRPSQNKHYKRKHKQQTLTQMSKLNKKYQSRPNISTTQQTERAAPAGAPAPAPTANIQKFKTKQQNETNNIMNTPMNTLPVTPYQNTLPASAPVNNK